jgi:hypothetical protein
MWMKCNNWTKHVVFLVGALLTISLAMPVSAGAQGADLKPVFIDVESAAMVKKLARMGIDIAAVRALPEGKTEYEGGFRVEAIVSDKDESKLKGAGLAWRSAKHDVAALQSASRQATDESAETVYHSFDEPIAGIKDRIYEVAANYPQLVELETIGYSIQNRPMLALCLSQQKKGHAKGHAYGHLNNHKPEVLILATHHAREWVATQMAMRLIDYLTQNYGQDPRVTALLDTTRLWIIPVANPDGYEYTFTNERLWRKNLRDNDENGEITIVDGVDINRNFASHWGLDDEGSSPIWSDATYRGPEPNSEPETRHVVDFVNNHDFKFLISYHTYSDLILYPWGWQVKTPSFDDPIFVAQAGTDDNPAIHDSLLEVGYDPGVGADLYTTNGDFTDWTYGEAGIPSYTVELTYGYADPEDESTYYGFEFPDDEVMVQQVFEDNLEFALSLIESAQDPANPKSPVGLTTEDIYHVPVTKSLGKRQSIEVLARLGKRPPSFLYQVNGGKWRRGKFSEMLGEFYNESPGLYYSGFRGFVPGQKTGDMVTYEISKGDTTLGPYTYEVENASESSILVVSAEDYTGDYPVYTDTSGPNYLSYYADALDAGGYGYDIWDVTAREAAPDYTEVLSNYDVAVWYTGDDYAATVPEFEVHEDMVLAMREFLNYGGKILATGQDLASLSTVYGMFSDDFFQYRMGAFIQVDGSGMESTEDTAVPYTVEGVEDDPVFAGLTLNLSGGDGADNQVSADSFLATSYFHPDYENKVAARYVRPGGPYDPYSGDYYVYSQMADQAFKRLGGVFDLPYSASMLTFWISYDIESDWDFAFVEIRQTGTDDWTTLPDIGGLTGQSTGESCLSGWVEEIHPQLGHYMDGDCEPEGTSGVWYALTGNSNGWKQITMDLSSYAGKKVEIYISYASDWGTQNLGVFVDDIEIDGLSLENFETSLGDWQVTTTAENTPFNNWVRIEGAGFPEGSIIRTEDTVYMGFGFESINSSDIRTEVMDRVMQYFGQ